jgi:redox-sensing transcriptional repressor
VLIGAGNLGHAIAVHINFEKYGCKLSGIFDSDERMIGQTIAGTKILSVDRLSEFCRQNQPKIAILCIPKSAAPQLCEQLIALGIKAFWNFSHYDINLEHNDIIVENVHLGDSLLALNYGVVNAVDKTNE